MAAEILEESEKGHLNKWVAKPRQYNVKKHAINKK